jgi:limonene-1,2-epoxide hydrolase
VGDTAEVVARRFFLAWENPSPDLLASFFSPDGVDVTVSGGVIRGVDAIRAHYRELLGRGFTDFRVEIKRMVAEGGTVMAERIDGFSFGGRRFQIEAVAVFEIDNEGRIERFRDYYDRQSAADQVEAAGLDAPARRSE